MLYESNRGLRVVDCSQKAARYGVRKGMPLAEASALVGKSERQTEKLHSLPYDPAVDRAALEKLARFSERFTPLVGLDTALPPESLLLEITGCERFFHGPAALAQQIQSNFQEQGYRVRVAVAGTVGGAWALSHYACSGSQEGKPLVVLEQLEAMLYPLPVACLRLTTAIVQTLQQLGIFTVGQLAALPRDGLASRFGSELLLRWQQALGEVSEVVQPYRGLPDLHAEWDFEAPTGRLPLVEQVSHRLLEQLISRFPAGYGAQQLTLTVHGVDGRQNQVNIEVYTPAACGHHWSQLLRLRLEPVRLEAPVGKVSLHVRRLAPLETRQIELFAGTTRERPEELADLLDRLSSRLGRQAVLRARPVAQAQPEHACQYLPVLQEGKEKSSRRPRAKKAGFSESTTVDECWQHRPAKLAPDPVPVTVVSVVPDGPPLRIRWSSRDDRFLRIWGPERIETGWWRGPKIARDYYRVETEQGNHLWLFRQRDDGRWFVHGWFD